MNPKGGEPLDIDIMIAPHPTRPYVRRVWTSLASPLSSDFANLRQAVATLPCRCIAASCPFLHPGPVRRRPAGSESYSDPSSLSRGVLVLHCCGASRTQDLTTSRSQSRFAAPLSISAASLHRSGYSRIRSRTIPHAPTNKVRGQINIGRPMYAPRLLRKAGAAPVPQDTELLRPHNVSLPVGNLHSTPNGIPITHPRSPSSPGSADATHYTRYLFFIRIGFVTFVGISTMAHRRGQNRHRRWGVSCAYSTTRNEMTMQPGIRIWDQARPRGEERRREYYNIERKRRHPIP